MLCTTRVVGSWHSSHCRFCNYYDNVLEDSRKASWGRVLFSNLARAALGLAAGTYVPPSLATRLQTLEISLWKPSWDVPQQCASPQNSVPPDTFLPFLVSFLPSFIIYWKSTEATLSWGCFQYRGRKGRYLPFTDVLWMIPDVLCTHQFSESSLFCPVQE